MFPLNMSLPLSTVAFINSDLWLSEPLTVSLLCVCSALRELCLTFYDMRATVVEVVARAMHLQDSYRDSQPQWARQMAALEALQIYAPLGHALGLRSISAAMEDQCFKVGIPCLPVRRSGVSCLALH